MGREFIRAMEFQNSSVGIIRSIWDEGGHYRQGAGKKGDARRKKEAKGRNKEDLKTEKTKNN